MFAVPDLPHCQTDLPTDQEKMRRFLVRKYHRSCEIIADYEARVNANVLGPLSQTQPGRWVTREDCIQELNCLCTLVAVIARFDCGDFAYVRRYFDTCADAVLQFVERCKREGCDLIEEPEALETMMVMFQGAADEFRQWAHQAEEFRLSARH